MKGDEILIGRTIHSIWINDEKDLIELETDSGWLCIVIESDCCSESWVEHVSLSEFIDGPPSRITKIEQVGIGEVVPTRQHSDLLYMINLEGKRIQRCTISNSLYTEGAIEFRNSSNGFYGGHAIVEKSNGDLSGFKRLDGDF